MTDAMRAEIGVFGGTGMYDFGTEMTPVEVETPFGRPSEPPLLGDVDGRTVAFLPRHGRDHRLPPHKINYRANIWAFRALGVRQVLAPCAVGSLRGDLGPGTFVVPDQLVDRTSGRAHTFFDEGGVHVAFADPYCPLGRAGVLDAARQEQLAAADGGVMVVVEGQRFSTRAESRWFAAQGWSLVNMTGYPEAVLARELAMCYTAIAVVTDLDAGLDAESAVAHRDVIKIFQENLGRLGRLISAAVPRLPTARSCLCAHAHDGLVLPFELLDEQSLPSIPGPAR